MRARTVMAWILGTTLGAACGGGARAPEDDLALPPDLLPAVCAERAAALQAAVDGARTSSAAAVAVASADCPTITIASGETAPDRLYRVGSITKTWVAATALSLVADGKLALDDTLDHFDVGVPDAASYTVRQLLQHTSGLYDYTRDPAFAAAAYSGKATTPAALVALATKHAPSFAPGTDWGYSNTNYIVLGRILEAVAEQPLAATLREKTLGPAHLAATFFAGGETVGGMLTPGFDKHGKDATDAYDPSWAWAAGAMVASASDTADWARALYGGEVLPLAERDALSATPVATGQDGLRYGLGTMVLADAITGGLGVGLGHAGDIAGYHSFVVYFPAKDVALVALVNEDGADPNALVVATLDALFGK